MAADANLGAGAVTLNGGTLEMTGTGVTIDNLIALGVNHGTVSNAQAVTLSGVISGGNNLTKTGAGTLTLPATQTYTGGTTVSAGTLSVAADGNLGTGAVTLNGGTLEVTGTGVTIDNLIALGSSHGTVSNANAVTLTGVISGTGNNLTKTGAGTLTLTATQTYTGTTTVSAGTLSVGVDGNLGSGALTLDGGTLKVTRRRHHRQRHHCRGRRRHGDLHATGRKHHAFRPDHGHRRPHLDHDRRSPAYVVTLSNIGNSSTFAGNLTMTAGFLRVTTATNLNTGTVTLGAGTQMQFSGSSGTNFNLANAITLTGNADNQHQFRQHGHTNGSGHRQFRPDQDGHRHADPERLHRQQLRRHHRVGRHRQHRRRQRSWHRHGHPERRHRHAGAGQRRQRR